MNKNEIIAMINEMGYEVEERAIYKREYDGEIESLTIKIGQVSPTIYPCTLEDADEDEVRALIERATSNVPNVDPETLLDGALDRVRIGVLPSGDYPFIHEPTTYEGIDEFYYIPVDEIGGNIKVTEDILDRLNVDKNTLAEVATKNTYEVATIQGIGDVLASMMGDDAPDMCDKPTMLVCSVDNKTLGAGVIMCSMLDALDKLGVDEMVMLPSSIHEVICVPYIPMETEMEYMSQMVREVNATQLAPNEVLANTAYIVSREGVRICA